MGDPHLFVDVHRLFADGTAADDERLQILAGEGPHPGRRGLAQAPIAMGQGIVPVGIVTLAGWPNLILVAFNGLQHGSGTLFGIVKFRGHGLSLHCDPGEGVIIRH